MKPMNHMKTKSAQTPSEQPETPPARDSVDAPVRQVRRAAIYSMTEKLMVQWERGEVVFKEGDDKVSPHVHGRTGIGYNVSFA